MQIIPVIDLKDGQVVHAVRGERSTYKPIHLHSILTASSAFEDVLNAFLTFYPFKTFYIADLNAICGMGDHAELIRNVLKQHPDREFWVDNGRQLDSVSVDYPKNYNAIIATESQQAMPQQIDERFILSLDYKQQALGHVDWFMQSDYWPARIIVMTLARVGSQAGPDFEKLQLLKKSFPVKQFIAAGGVRNGQDLHALENLGMSGVLLATALHTGAIRASDISGR
ncbi:HisA/HisF-related TIM barrel protein [Methylomonas sp. AM2-LC]|uniref:HisA/HisF-related TIM barrel protein n=1 Tax=Methylomonas sp. AM2-LC TaxID=3153301 RepID=UPI003265CF68